MSLLVTKNWDQYPENKNTDQPNYHMCSWAPIWAPEHRGKKAVVVWCEAAITLWKNLSFVCTAGTLAPSFWKRLMSTVTKEIWHLLTRYFSLSFVQINFWPLKWKLHSQSSYLSRGAHSHHPRRRPAGCWWYSSSHATPGSYGCQTEPQSAPQTWWVLWMCSPSCQVHARYTKWPNLN